MQRTLSELAEGAAHLLAIGEVRGDVVVTGIVTQLGEPSGEMSIEDNSTATDIDTAGAWHAVRLFAAQEVAGFTFEEGLTGAVSAFTGVAGGKVRVTSAGHGLQNGDFISITGTTNYNDLFGVSGVTTDTFDIVHSDDGDDGTGTWNKGASLTASVACRYHVDASISASIELINHTFEFAAVINTVVQTKIIARRKYSAVDVGNTGLVGILNLAAGDKVMFVTRNVGATGNITFEYLNFTLSR